MNQDDLYNAVNNDSLYLQHPLTQDYNAEENDLEAIQMYLLVIGNYALFISTYAISPDLVSQAISIFLPTDICQVLLIIVWSIL